MSDTFDREKLIFEEALSFASGEARNAYLEEACRDDEALRQEIEALIEAHAGAERFIPTSPSGNAEVTDPGVTAAERPGVVIDRYKLLQQIGEGGMGVVYMAEQEQPVRRRVALKIIKLGMDTKQVVARFEAERQALALMDHPNIARVLDGGATNSGRPYFVMELVQGVAITEFCNTNLLPALALTGMNPSILTEVDPLNGKGVEMFPFQGG
jgi:hypothetical protein